MNHRLWMRRAAAAVVLAFAVTGAHADGHGGAKSLADIAAGDHRSAGNIARNEWRHPVETLTWFGLEPGMTVVEMAPGGGWYTEILAPYLRESGRLYGAHHDLNAESEYRRRSSRQFVAKLAGEPDVYDKVEVTVFAPPEQTNIGPEGEVDMILVFRNVHGWLRGEIADDAFETFYRTLKPGGVVGVVQHRGDPDTPQDPEARSGYVNEQVVIDLATAAGFELAAKSEINANARDTKDHPSGVWSLPPSLRDGDETRDKFAAIGESDRMTLKFVKPGGAM